MQIAMTVSQRRPLQPQTNSQPPPPTQTISDSSSMSTPTTRNHEQQLPPRPHRPHQPPLPPPPPADRIVARRRRPAAGCALWHSNRSDQRGDECASNWARPPLFYGQALT